MDDRTERIRFKRLGQDVKIWPLAKIIAPEVISLGDSVIIDDFVLLMGGEETIVGSFVHIASFVSITGGGKLILEDFVGISSGSRVFTGDDDYKGGSLTGPTIPPPFRQVLRSFVHIKKHAIIGANTVILPGVVIGEGVSIGANSLVKKDCEPWWIYAGSPAKPIAPRQKDKVLSLEAQLRLQLYDSTGNYVPKNRR